MMLQALTSIGPSHGFKLLANASACILHHVLIISVDTSSVTTPFQLIRQRFILILSAIQFAAQHYDFFNLRNVSPCTIYSIPQKCFAFDLFGVVT